MGDIKEEIILQKKIRWRLIKVILFIIILLVVAISWVLFFYSTSQGPITKPIIYIYPQEETEVSVKVGYPDSLTCTYPKYENGWDVIASPDGNLKDVKTGRNLYALYWEGIRTKEGNIEDGFVVKGENVARFLEEKLEILGLNEREAEEFIVYWLPILEKNEYNFIRFYEKEEINEMMPLEINPEPETLIRVLMGWKKLDKNIDIKEQKLEKVQRTGYTVVEWGGTEIKGSVIK